MKTLFSALILLCTASTFAGTPLRTEGGHTTITERVTVDISEGHELAFTTPDGRKISLTCDKDFDDFYNNSFLSWEGINEKINGAGGLLFLLENPVGVFKRSDFYCDTFSGKMDEEVYQIWNRVHEATGKEIDLVATISIITTQTETQRIESVAVTQLDFREAGGAKLIARYAGRPGQREENALKPFTTTSIEKPTNP